MTEQEIIEYLKGNKKEGRILAFMPDEVKAWCEEHIKELRVWQSDRWCKFNADDICTYNVVALPDDYEELKGEWIECEINKKNDCFFINGHYYHWSEWNTCLIQNNDWVKAFGGWQYANSNTWFMTPKLKTSIADLSAYEDSFNLNHYASPAACTCKPAIPVKIRFWKGEEND